MLYWAIMFQQYFVYVLRCADGSLYTGCTSNLERRTAQHQAGKGAKYTRSRRPVSLIAFVLLNNKGDAMRLEERVKRMRRMDKLYVIASAFELVAPLDVAPEP